MPAQSSLTADDKVKVKSSVKGSKVLHAGLARIYYAYPKPDKWNYTGLQGAIAFVREESNDIFSFKMIDLEGTRGVIWEHEFYDGFDFFSDRPFFYSFAGDECMIGFVFTNEPEAKAFFKKVTSRKIPKAAKSPEKKKSKPSKGGRIDKSMISGPKVGSFIHVAHMGYDSEKGFTSTGVDPSWMALLTSLEGAGITQEVIQENQEFIKDFVRDYQKQVQQQKVQPKKPKPPPPAKRTVGGKGSITEPPPPPPAPPGPPPAATPPQRAPPLVPNTKVSPVPQKLTPAPPPVQPPRRPPSQVAPPAPPLRPAARPAAPPPHPPAPPARPPPPPVAAPARPTSPIKPLTNGIATPPPPPPAPPAPPPPPPPPVASSNTTAPSPPPPPPPPPPAPPSGSSIGTPSVPTPQPGRAALLDSIKGKGIHSLKKTDGDTSSPSSTRTMVLPTPDRPVSSGSANGYGAGAASPTNAGTTASGQDLTSALISALEKRNKNMGDSDEDGDDDGWDSV